MMGFIRDMLRSPEAHKDPYTWATVFSGHAYIALGPWAALAIILDRWTAAVIVSLAYLIVWEGAQLALAPKRTRSLYWDAILDTVAVAFACVAASLYGDGELMAALSTWCASVVVMAAGVRKRQ